MQVYFFLSAHLTFFSSSSIFFSVTFFSFCMKLRLFFPIKQKKKLFTVNNFFVSSFHFRLVCRFIVCSTLTVCRKFFFSRCVVFNLCQMMYIHWCCYLWDWITVFLLLPFYPHLLAFVFCVCASNFIMPQMVILCQSAHTMMQNYS